MKVKVHKYHIQCGQRDLSDACPITLAILDASDDILHAETGLSKIRVMGFREVYEENPDFPYGGYEPDSYLRAWIKDFDDGTPVNEIEIEFDNEHMEARLIGGRTWKAENA